MSTRENLTRTQLVVAETTYGRLGSRINWQSRKAVVEPSPRRADVVLLLSSRTGCRDDITENIEEKQRKEVRSKQKSNGPRCEKSR